jgi:hypothetical protein
MTPLRNVIRDIAMALTAYHVQSTKKAMKLPKRTEEAGWTAIIPLLIP